MRKDYLISMFLCCAGVSPVLAQTAAPAPSAGVPFEIPRPHAQPSASSYGVVDDHGGAQPGASPCCVPDDCCAPKKVCGPPGRFWVSAEYLLWWIKGSPSPALVTTGPASPITPPPGAIGTPGTVVLLGGNNLDPGAFSGGRFTAGFWLNECQTKGIEASYFFLGSQSNDTTLSSSGAPGSPVLARPFFDVSTGLPNSELIAFPGLASGSVSVQSSTQLQGAQANMICNLCCCGCCSCCDSCDPCVPARRTGLWNGYRVDLLGGMSYLNLNQSLGIGENTQVLPGATGTALDGANISAFDQFNTTNQFYGPQIGARAQVWRNRLFANVSGILALGVTHQTASINGSTTIALAGGPTLVVPGDLLAQSSNIGQYSRNQFSIVPQMGANIGYQVTNHLGLFVGYSFLFWTGVEQPGDTIDPRVNSTRVPTASFLGVAPAGPAAPLFSFHNSDLWAQGINLGAQLRF